MTAFLWILLAIVLLFLIARLVALKMYALEQTPHHETPAKFDITFTECHFPTEHDRSLYGWWMRSKLDPKTAPTVVLVHGWSRNLGRTLRYIQNLHPQGYNLLAFDARHHGSSDPDGHASMYKFGQDIRAAVQYALTQEIDPLRIGVLGLSIGGAGAVYAAALEPLIKAVVTVGAPAHPVDVMQRQFRQYHLPRFLIWLALKQIESKIGAHYEDFAPVNNIAKSKASFLIIHGSEDEVVHPSQGEKLFQACSPGQGELWSISGKAHSNCHHEKGFWDKLRSFYDLKLSTGGLV